MMFIQEIIYLKERSLDEFKPIEAHGIALHVNGNIVIYFERSQVEHIPREFKIFIGNKNIKTNIYIMNAYNSIMCG